MWLMSGWQVLFTVDDITICVTQNPSMTHLSTLDVSGPPFSCILANLVVFVQLHVEYLFQSLDINNVLKVVACMMQEHKILVYSSHLVLLTTCIELLLALMYPFKVR